MKKMIVLILAAFLTSASLPAFAEDVKASKDECILASKGCKNEVDSIQTKIKKLQTEINKGTKVYTAEEIKKLDAKLKEASALLDNLLSQ